jgi:hypothetical protein
MLNQNWKRRDNLTVKNGKDKSTRMIGAVVKLLVGPQRKVTAALTDLTHKAMKYTVFISASET